MSVDLAKAHFVNLKKVASEAVDSVGLGSQRARVALALDISVSMSDLFSNGTVQTVVEKLLALGVKFDDNQAIDIFLFGERDYEVGELQESDFYQYVNTHIIRKYFLEGGTRYAGVMKRIVNKYTGGLDSQGGSFLKKIFGGSKQSDSKAIEPAYVMFVTDGDNSDQYDAEAVIKQASDLGIFWQFVGIGRASFNFLNRLDTLGGRKLDNTSFFHLNDFNEVGDKELYGRLLKEFPNWIKEAKSQGIIL